jgi:hypothetical protein
VQQRARLGQAHPARAALEERHADVALEPGYALRDGGLAESQDGRRAREPVVLDDRREDAQRLQVQRHTSE